MSHLKVLRLGHCCKIWAVVSVACLQKRQCGVFSALNFECMCCLSLLCPVLMPFKTPEVSKMKVCTAHDAHCPEVRGAEALLGIFCL